MKKSLPITDNESELGLVDSFITAVSYCLESSKIYCLCLSGEIKEVEKDLSKVTASLEGAKRAVQEIFPHPSVKDSFIIVDSYGKILITNLKNETYRCAKTLESYNRYI